MDAADLRRLGRALREEERAAGESVPRPSDVLLAEALAEPERLVGHDPAYARGAQRLGLLLRKARELLAGGGTAEEALWPLWDGTPWPAAAGAAPSQRGGAAGRNADRDLDAVCALFDAAARAEERSGGRGALNFLEELDAQDIAADTLARRAVRPDAVRLMTAHRSKGLEWRLVVVAGVQEGLWPDLRRRGSLLEADRIGRDGLAEPLPPGALLAEERRLFYVAATRAKERLVVTAVAAAGRRRRPALPFPDRAGRRAQADVDRPPAPPAVGRPRSSPSCAPPPSTRDASPALREAAARAAGQARGAARRGGPPAGPGRAPAPLVGPARAHPHRGAAARPGPARRAVRQRAGPARQHLLAAVVPGPRGQGRRPRDRRPGLRQRACTSWPTRSPPAARPADLAVLMERLDSVWDALAFDAPWKSRQEKEQRAGGAGALPALARHGARRGPRTGGRQRTRLRRHARGRRVRRCASAAAWTGSSATPQGRAYVVDFKTGKRPRPRGPEVARHPQLAVYQLAVREGAADDLFDGAAPSRAARSWCSCG